MEVVGLLAVAYLAVAELFRVFKKSQRGGMQEETCWVLKGAGNCCGRAEHRIVTRIDVQDPDVVVYLEDGYSETVESEMAAAYLYYVLNGYFELVTQGLSPDQLVVFTSADNVFTTEQLRLMFDMLRDGGKEEELQLHHK